MAGVVEVLVALVVSLLVLLVALVASLLSLVVSALPFFTSFRILSFNLFMYFSLPLRAASTRFGSFVTFSGVLSMSILRYKEKELKQTWTQFLNILFLIQPGKR